MPNHCDNTLTVFGPQKDVDKFVEAARGTRPNYAPSVWDLTHATPPEVEIQHLNFHSLRPVPRQILARQYDKGGYDWQSEWWGTKWGAYGDNEPPTLAAGSATYEFRTAWSTPDALLRYASRNHPTLTFALSFSEEYPSRGRRVFRGGEVGVTLTEADCPVEWDDSLGDDDNSENFDEWAELYTRNHSAWVESLKEVYLLTGVC